MTFFHILPRAFLLLSLLMVPSRGQSEEKAVLNWHVSHFPPVNIMQGPFKGTGFADKTRKYFQDHLPLYQHQENDVGFGASMEASKTGELFCRADMIKTPEREETLYFSSPIFFASSRRLIFAGEKYSKIQPFLNGKGEVDFEKLLNSEELTFSYVTGRAYYKNEPEALVQYREKHPELAHRTSRAAYESMRDGKADLLVIYPFEFIYYLKEENLHNAYKSLKIQGLDPFSMAYITCIKSEVGKQIIDAVNGIIAKEKGIYHWLEYYREWVSEDEWKRVELAFRRNAIHQK